MVVVGPNFCLECGAPLVQTPRGRPRLWCSDRCRKRFVWWIEYVMVHQLMHDLQLSSHAGSRVPNGSCLKCGKPLRSSGFRPRLYCGERCRSAFRRARELFRSKVRDVVASRSLELAA
jgi:endogenous inhibitor of DNA gyrase (YacG/DUF329 family)